MTFDRRSPERAPTHPGYIVGMELEELGLTITEASARLHVSRRSLSELVNERRSVSPEMAMKLGRFFGNGTEIWMNLQTRFNHWEVEHDRAALREAEKVAPAIA